MNRGSVGRAGSLGSGTWIGGWVRWCSSWLGCFWSVSWQEELLQRTGMTGEDSLSWYLLTGDWWARTHFIAGTY